MSLLKEGTPLVTVAAKAEMSEATARKYRREKKVPSELRSVRSWRMLYCTLFRQVWSESTDRVSRDASPQADGAIVVWAASRQAATRLLRSAPALRVTRSRPHDKSLRWPKASFRPCAVRDHQPVACRVIPSAGGRLNSRDSRRDKQRNNSALARTPSRRCGRTSSGCWRSTAVRKRRRSSGNCGDAIRGSSPWGSCARWSAASVVDGHCTGPRRRCSSRRFGSRACSASRTSPTCGSCR